MAMVGVVLVIACSNVAMLLVARNTARQREFSLRIAIGATRFQLFRQLLTESLLLVAAGTALAGFLAIWATEGLVAGPAWASMCHPIMGCWHSPWPYRHSRRCFLAWLPCQRLAILFRNRTQEFRTHSLPRQDSKPHRAGGGGISNLPVPRAVGGRQSFPDPSKPGKPGLGAEYPWALVFGITPPQVLRKDAEVVHFYHSLMDRLRALPGVESATLMENRMGRMEQQRRRLCRRGEPPQRYFVVHALQHRGAGLFPRPWYPHSTWARLHRRRLGDFPEGRNHQLDFCREISCRPRTIRASVAFDRGSKADQYTIVGVVQDSKYTSVEEKARPMAYFPYTQISCTATMTANCAQRATLRGCCPRFAAPYGNSVRTYRCLNR